MDKIFEFNYSQYYNMTNEGSNEHHSPRRAEHGSADTYSMHPLLEHLPSMNAAQGRFNTSVNRMRAPAPTSKSNYDYSELFGILERYGDGEEYSNLKLTFPRIQSHLSFFGLSSRMTATTMLRNLNPSQIDLITYQIERRIKNLLTNEKDQEAAMNSLKIRLDNAKAQAAAAEADEAAVATAEAAELAAAAENRPHSDRSLIETIMQLIPQYAAGEVNSIDRQADFKFFHYLNRAGGYTKRGRKLFESSTAGEMQIVETAIKERRLAISSASPATPILNSMSKKGVITILHQNPHLLLDISSKLKNKTLSIEDATDSLLSQRMLERLVDEENGELTALGEEVISRADASMQAAIRSNFRLRYQQSAPPANIPPPPRFIQQEENLPAPSFFSGMGYQGHEMETVEMAIKERKLATSFASPSTPILNSMLKKGALITLHQSPHLLLDMSSKLKNKTLSIEDATDSLLSQRMLEKLVDEGNGELTALGEEVISRADASMQEAIRFNFRLRYRQSAPPANTPPPPRFIQQEENLPAPSFFSGVSAQWRGMGYQGYEREPSTPLYPPQSPASTFGGLSSLNQGTYYRGEFQLDTPQEVEQPWRPYSDYEREPSTPLYPPQSPASTFGGLSSLNQGTYYRGEFQLDTPQEVEQPWRPYSDYATQAPVEQSLTPAMSPGRIDVDNMPTPQSTEGAGLQGLTATSWLGDEHMLAYTQLLAHRLEGQPNAELLNFADPVIIAMLMFGDRTQEKTALRRLAGRDTPPIVFLPINNPESHWSLLVIDRRTDDAFHYDSSINPEQAEDATNTAQYKLAKKAARAMGIDTYVMGTPIAQQQDGYSCGDHVLTGIEVLAHRVIDGTFADAGGRDLSDIKPDRGLIADLLTHAEQLPAESSARKASEPPIEQKKKKGKWRNL